MDEDQYLDYKKITAHAEGLADLVTHLEDPEKAFSLIFPGYIRIVRRRIHNCAMSEKLARDRDEE